MTTGWDGCFFTHFSATFLLPPNNLAVSGGRSHTFQRNRGELQWAFCSLNSVVPRKNRPYLSALLPPPGEIIRRPESEYLIMLKKKCGWYSRANLERFVGLRFPLSSVGKLSVCIWITSSRAKLEFLTATALLNKSILFGNVGYMILLFCIFFEAGYCVNKY